MGLKIMALGGYGEVGRNCTAVIVDEEVVLLDLGLHMENYVTYTQDEEDFDVTAKKLLAVNAIPDINQLKKLKKNILAIVPSHAHLDHIGAIPFLANQLRTQVICTPFTAKVLDSMIEDKNISFRSPIKQLSPNSKLKLSEKITLEFIYTTHSIPHAVMIAVHTPYGTVLYANDFKFDLYPTLGQKPNFNRLSQLRGSVKVLIIDSLYAKSLGVALSESVAKEMLKDVMLSPQNHDKAMVVTTFASHIARLKSIIQIAKNLDREIVFIGRSIQRYTKAAQDLKIFNFKEHVKRVYYGKNKVSRITKKIMQNGKHKFLLVVTGHQGEPKALLSKMIDEKTAFEFTRGDRVIFSCKTIPAKATLENRKILEEKLLSRGVRILKDIHVSGHGKIEDMRSLIEITCPENILPSHSDINTQLAFLKLAEEEGYTRDQNVFILKNNDIWS